MFLSMTGSVKGLLLSSLFSFSFAQPATPPASFAMPVATTSTCRGTQTEWGICPVARHCQGCTPVNCVLGHWSRWSSCDCSGLRTRSRVVVQDKNDCGTPCDGVLTETMKCKVSNCRIEKDCQFSPWSNWADEKTGQVCVDYQKTRTRTIAQQPANGGDGCTGTTKETLPCGTPPTPLHASDCVLGNWEPWSPCSETCGFGRRTRRRSVVHEAAHGGRPCEDELEISEQCGSHESLASSACPNDEPCVWDSWAEWSACSCTCGGGQKRRERQILRSPKGLGQLCEARNKKEISPCNTQTCGAADRDGRWGFWEEWGDCSQKCDGGVQKRKRVVAVFARGGGKPAEGSSEEYRQCNTQGCDVNIDCSFNPWDAWSTCSCTCNGVMHRTRSINHYGAGQDGKSCSGAVQEIRPCNFGPGMGNKCGDVSEDCRLAAWTQWSQCSVSCGPGQTTRTRVVATPAVGAGRPCDGILEQTRPCHMKPCVACKKCGTKVLDCKWGQWEPWSRCDLCTGQARRVRLIEEMPENGGAPCDAKVSEEVKACLNGAQRQCGKSYWCVWTGWANWDESTCSDTCDAFGVRKRQRGLALVHHPTNGAFVSVSQASACQSAVQHEDGVCAKPKYCANQREHCVDCRTAPWSPWSSCDCTGLRSRQRNVETPNNECGEPCSTTLAETRRCKPTCRQPPKNCVLSQWSNWHTQSDYVPDDNTRCQRYRKRTVLQNQTRGGLPCTGILKMTAPCSWSGKAFRPLDCQLSDWSGWTQCSVTCGSGTRYRTRTITRNAQDGGAPCSGPLMETDDCTGVGNNGVELAECTSDAQCRWGEWVEWSPCTCKCGGGQKRRSRQIDQYPTGNEETCPEKPAAEIAPCNTQSCESACIDGLWAMWSEWTSCSQSCDGGIQWRTRDVERPASSCGEPVRGKASEFQRCNVQSCEGDAPCLFSGWGHWSDCSCSCNGVKHRSRSIRQYGKGKHGRYCEGPIHEISACNAGPQLPQGCVDESGPCKLSHWSRWSECSASCGHGQKTRSRTIAEPAFGGGDPCPDSALTEMAKCNARMRCPKDPVKHCQWSNWGEWGHCDKCGGQKRRFRYITQMPENGGRACNENEIQQAGATAATASPESYAVHAEEVTSCPRQCHEQEYCTWSMWGEWGACPASCDAHTRKRDRHLVVTTQEPEDSEAKFAVLKADHESIESWNSVTSMLAIVSVVSTLLLASLVLKVRAEVRAASGGVSVAPTEARHQMLVPEQAPASSPESERPLLNA